MATYTGTPKTWAAGETLLASDMNAEIRDPVAALAGAWNSYTPTLAGFTPGNGVGTGKYLQIGKLVIFRAQFIFGTTSAAASAIPYLTLPVTAANVQAGAVNLTARFLDSGSAWYSVVGAMSAALDAVSFAISGTNGENVTPSTTAPFTWATGDGIFVSGIYEAA